MGVVIPHKMSIVINVQKIYYVMDVINLFIKIRKFQQI